MAKKKYINYKPSKTLWQDEIPSHWQETDLRMVFTENKVKNTDLIERNLLSLSYGKLKRKDIDNATGLVPASFEGYQIIEDGFIVLRFTDLQNDKKSLRVGYCPERGIITNAYVAIAPKENTISKFYYYQLHFLDTIKYFYNLGGGVRQSLSYKEFGRETVIVPEPEEQTKIAAFLDYKLAKVDRFIHKKKQLIKLLNEQKAAIINQAVTKGLNSNAKMKPSGIEWLGDIPEHWSFSKLGVVAKVIDPQPDHRAPKEDPDGLPYIGIRDIDLHGKVTISTARLVVEEAITKQEQSYEIENDDIVFCKVGTLGLPRFFKKPKSRFGLSATMVVIKIPEKKIKVFTKYFLESNYVLHQINSIVTGSTRPALGIKQIRKIKILIPPLYELDSINPYISKIESDIFKTISKVEKEIALIQEYKTALIAEAVTGKIDVRDYEIPEIVDEESNEEQEEELSLGDESKEIEN